MKNQVTLNIKFDNYNFNVVLTEGTVPITKENLRPQLLNVVNNMITGIEAMMDVMPEGSKESPN